MKEYPMIFNTDMVKAILEGRKTQTRRVIMPQPGRINDNVHYNYKNNHYLTAQQLMEFYPYGEVSDLLWVRETWQEVCILRKDRSEQPAWIYKADDNDIDTGENDLNGMEFKWRPSIHMPKEVCRLRLQITERHAEPLQNITHKDARAEGLLHYYDEITQSERYKDYLADASGYGHPDHDYPTCSDAITSFRTLWDLINNKRGFGWDANPLVWVTEFKVAELAKNDLYELKPTGK